MDLGDIRINIIVNTSQTAAGLQTVNVGLQGIERTASGLQSQNVRLASSFQDIGLSMLGIQGGLGVLLQAKNVIGDLIGEANKLQATNLGLENVANFKGIPADVIKNEVRNLDIVKNGILSYGEAAQGVSNLMRSGLNLQQATNLLKGFTDSAVFGRQASLELGYAVVSGTEGWRNNNNMLLDNMGMTTNIAVLNKRAGLSEEELANKTTDSSVATRQYNEVMKELGLSTGNAEKYTETFAGTQTKLATQTTITKQKVGELIQDAYKPMLSDLTGLIDNTGKFAGKLDEVTKNAPGTAEGIKRITLEMTAMNLLVPGLGMISTAFHLIQDSVKDAGDRLDLFLNDFARVNEYMKDSVFFGWLTNDAYKPKEGKLNSNSDFRDDEFLGIPSPFKNNKPVGKGGDVPGHDIAGESDLTKKKTGHHRTKTEQEETLESLLARMKEQEALAWQEYQLGEKTLAQVRETFQAHLTELDTKTALIEVNKKNLSLEKQAELSAKNRAVYNQAHKDLEEKIDYSKTIEAMKYIIQANTASQISTNKYLADPKHPGFNMGRGLIDYDALKTAQEYGGLSLQSMVKETPKVEIDLKGGLEGFQTFMGSLKSDLDILGVKSDTWVGTIVNGLDTSASFIKNILSAIQAFQSGDGIFGLLKMGLSFIPGGGAAAAAAGGMLGNSFSGGTGNISPAGIGRMISSETQRIVERPYILTSEFPGDKMRVMLKEVDLKRQRLNPNN